MLLSRVASKAFSVVRAPEVTDDATVSAWGIVGGARKTRAGTTVSPDNAMGLVAVYSATSLIAETIASLPVHITKPDASGNKHRSKPAQYGILWDRPNPWQTRSALYSSAVLSLLLWGNFYAAVSWDRGGKAVGVWPIDPARVAVDVRDNGDVVFDIAGHGKVMNVAGSAEPAIWWIQGITKPGRAKGLSPIEEAMEQIGIAKAVERSAAGFYGQGMQPGGIIRAKQKLTPDGARELAGRMRSANGGVDNAGKWAVIDQDAEIAALVIPPQQAQFIEQQRWTSQQVASLFRVPPHLIGDVQRSSSWGTGIEEQTIGFVTFTLNPWIKRIEESAEVTFLRGGGYELEIMVQGLMRGSTVDRYQAYAVALQNGFKTPNEIRRLEGDPDIEGGDAMTQAANLYGGKAPPSAPPAGADDGADDGEADA